MKNHEYSIDLIKQMAECDANYIRLLKLVPGLRAFRNKSMVRDSYFEGKSKVKTKSDSHHSRGEIDQKQAKQNSTQDLHGKVAEFYISDGQNSDQKIVVEISVIECFKYTTTLEIVQKPNIGKWVSNPTMQIRVYHDASTAEVTSYQSHRNFKPKYSQPNSKMYHRDEKTQVNRFLGEWLTHCLEAGRCIKVPSLAFNS
jgi:uncharacterized protein YqiB (DUF1249 family)